MSNKIINIVPKRKVLFEKYDKMVFLEEFLIGKFHESEVKIPTNNEFETEIIDSTFYVLNNTVLFQKYYSRNELWINYELIWSVFKNEFNDESKEIIFIEQVLSKYIEVNFYVRGDSPNHSPWWKELKF